MKKIIVLLGLTLATCSQLSGVCSKKCFSADCSAQCVMAEMICKAMSQ